MDIQQFISSGILENYVLGLTNDAENIEVEALKKKHPEVQAEIRAIEESLGKLAERVSKEPAPALKENIFARIRDLEKAEKVSLEKEVIPLKKTVSGQESHYSWWIAASITLLIISSGINAILYNRWKSAENELATIINEKEVMANQFKIEKTNFDRASKDLAILKHPGNKIITLKGSSLAPNALAVVYWNINSHEVFLNVNSFPEAPPGMQFQLWAIVEGQPVDAGMLGLDVSNNSLQQMKSFENAQSFAITLEKAGGSPTPNLTALYVIGNV